MEQIKIIKINYNSIQINDNKVKVLYYSNDGKSIGVIVKGYSHIPYDFGSVIRNDTDIYSDYFDNDSLTIYEDNPLYNYFMIAYLKTEKREYNRYIKKCKDKDYFAKNSLIQNEELPKLCQ